MRAPTGSLRPSRRQQALQGQGAGAGGPHQHQGGGDRKRADDASHPVWRV